MIKYNIQPNKTYKTEANAEKAIKKHLPHVEEMNVAYSIIWNSEGRCFPVFFGAEAVHKGIFNHFNVINF